MRGTGKGWSVLSRGLEREGSVWEESKVSGGPVLGSSQERCQGHLREAAVGERAGGRARGREESRGEREKRGDKAGGESRGGAG